MAAQGSEASVLAARAAFPSGLEQPDGTYRSGLDALLLADFIPSLTSLHFADLGTGCGMAACALALRLPQAQGIGLDWHGPSVACAERNIRRLALDDRLRMAEADVADIKTLRGLCPEPLDVVMANPPYRETGSGRASPDAAREQALCGPPGTLDAFCAAAYALLRHHGYCSLVFTASRLGDVLDSLRRHRLGPRRLRCVHTRPERPAKLILLEGRKDCAENLTIEPPLLLGM